MGKTELGRYREAIGHAEQGLGFVRAGLEVLGPQPASSSSVPARAARQLVQAAAQLKTSLIIVGRLPAGAALIDERPPAVHETPQDAAASVVHLRVAAERVVLNLSAPDARAVLRVLELGLAVAAGDHLDHQRASRVRDLLAPRVSRARKATREHRRAAA